MSKFRDYYEVLNVTKEATKEDIRKAYKKQALVWHPDRNLDNQEEATHKFKEIQDAYETLFDDNERAWYDENKHIIMKGGMAAAKSGACDDDVDREPDQLNLWSYLSSSCYTTFNSKDKDNFYKIYQTVFDTILKEDEEYKSSKKVSGSSSNTNVQSPSFGDENSSFEQVNKFYTFWSTYSTKRSFAWKDKYRLSDAENRYIRRQIEKENEMERSKARKEYNDLVKHLLKKVKADDPRVKEEMKRRKKMQDEIDKKKEEDRLLQEKLKKEYLAEKERLRQQLLNDEFSDGDEDVHDEFSDEEEFNRAQDALDEVEDLYDNLFVGDSKKKNNKNGKSNKKQAVVEEEDDEEEVTEEPEEEVEQVIEKPATVVEEEELVIEEESSEKKTPISVEPQPPAENEAENDDDNFFGDKKSKKEKKKQKKLKKGVVYMDREQIEILKESIEQAKQQEKTKSKKKSGKKKKGDDSDEEFVPKATTKKNEPASKSSKTNTKPSSSKTEPKASTSSETAPQEDKPTEEKTVTPEQETTENVDEEEVETGGKKDKKKRRAKDKKEKKDTSLKCNVCGGEFPTRNSLFQHIKDEGHALHK